MARVIRDVITLLNRLIHLDYDAIETLKAAIGRLSDPDDKAALTSFLAEHRHHADDVALVVRNLGGEPASHGDLRQVLTRGKVVLGALSGELSILEAMRSNEDEVVSAYESAASQPGIPIDVRSVLLRNLADEREHRRWFEERLDVSQPTAGAPAT